MSTPPGVETRGRAIEAVCIVAPIIAGIFVSLRVWARLGITKSFGADDWAAVLTLIVSVVYSVLIGISTHHGMGMHMADQTTAIKTQYFKWIMIASEFYALGLLGYKTAILLLYLRLFGVNKKFKWACWAVMIFNAGYLLSNIFLQIFSCSPVQKFFQKDLPGHCVGLIPPDIAWGAMSMLSDLAIAILPLHVVWHLHLNRRERILLSLVFLSGIIAFGVATIRWIYATLDLSVVKDRSWYAGVSFLLSVLEVNTGLICSCTPTFKPLFRFARVHMQSYAHWPGRKSSNYSGNSDIKVSYADQSSKTTTTCTSGGPGAAQSGDKGLKITHTTHVCTAKPRCASGGGQNSESAVGLVDIRYSGGGQGHFPLLEPEAETTEMSYASKRLMGDHWV